MTSGPAIVERDPEAPRLIDWTGERCVPWAPDAVLVHEHQERYLWAAGLIGGRRVLDLASGEGFGAAILATTARSVLGIDIDGLAIAHSTSGYRLTNLRFEVADALDLAALPDAGFDAVVAFGLLDRLADHERVLDEVRRVLAPDGLLIISTSDGASQAKGSADSAEPGPSPAARLQTLLAGRFANVSAVPQSTIAARGEPAAENGIPPSNGAANGALLAHASSILSLASDASLPTAAAPAIVAVAAPSAATASAGEALRRAHEVIAQQESDLARARREVSLVRLRGTAECAHVRALEHHIDATVAAYERSDAAVRADLYQVSRRLLRIDGSVVWQLFQRLRALIFRGLGGEGSRRVRALQATLRVVGRRLDLVPEPPDSRVEWPPVAAPSPAPARIAFPATGRPEVSIVMPVHANAELTRAALESIRESTPFPAYEVIIVDDSDDRPTKELLSRVDGARIVVNPRNLGYSTSITRGAAIARGRWLVLCNNDIVVRPGWLDAMIDCAESSAEIAIVTPKYLYPDGSLSEAGAVIWRDGSGANYGRAQDAHGCLYAYRRDVDYGSAAALLVRADVWKQLGGYDERFAPMYYEDTDLCFAARAAGFRVVYEPRAEVIHIEGATAGLDPTAGPKRYVTLNRPRFERKWRDQLARHFDNDGAMIWHAANRVRDCKVLVVDHTVPMWDRDAGSLRMREILRSLLELGCHVTFIPENGAPLQPYTSELQRLGVEVIYDVSPDLVIETIGPSLSLAILSRPQPAAHWLDKLREHAPDALIAYDTVDLHWLREARRAAADADEELVFSPRARALRELENALIRSADTTIVVTATEAERVRADVPDAAITVLPIGNAVRPLVPPVDERAGIVFVGGFAHPPNVDAALVLVERVMPLVWRDLPDVTVAIVGADPPPDVLRLGEGDRVEVTGWVADLEGVLAATRALVAPLRFGAGLKGKVTQAMAEGVPVVTTPIGAEGLDATHGEHLMIGVGADELAAHTIAILTDDELWHQLSSVGQLLIADRGSPAAITSAIRSILARVPPRPAPS